jgi:hypothetical protein
MRLKDLKPLNEQQKELPFGINHTLPQTVAIPEMDLYYEFYKFVTNMACHPDTDNQMQTSAMRDIPVAVAYTPQEYDMIKDTAKRMGFDLEDVAYKKSQEPPGGNVVSPVMQFDTNMFESSEDRALRIGRVKEQFMSLLEASSPALAPDIENTISPTMSMPDLVNSDTYRQYRYALALAAAKAVAAGEVGFDAASAWNEALTGVAYAPQELEIFDLANKLMGVHGVMLSRSPSKEPDDTFTTSPTMKFDPKMFESSSENMREIINKIGE